MTDEIVAESKEKVGRVAIDFFSWGHIDMGIAVFLLWSLINLLPSAFEKTLMYIVPFWFSIVLTVGVAIIWEILENTVLYDKGFKFEGRRDSPKNAFWDVLFVILGGLFMWGVKTLIVNFLLGVDGIFIFYIVGISTFVIVVIAFFIGRAMTK
ncbi:MAG: hypothetical protein ACFFCI_13510 [Promethearchaeota archaeon]